LKQLLVEMLGETQNAVEITHITSDIAKSYNYW